MRLYKKDNYDYNSCIIKNVILRFMLFFCCIFLNNIYNLYIVNTFYGDLRMQELIDINFKMNITNDDQKYEIQFYEKGKRYIKNKKTFIKFKEPAMDNNEYNNLMFICDPDQIVIIRSGQVQMKQKYIENEHTTGYYNNEYISSEITAFTNKYDFTDQGIYLNYDIILDNNVIGNYQMEVSIKGVDTYE